MNPPPARYAAMDIGSNAVRLLVGQFRGQRFVGEVFTRIPLQLGDDAFNNGGKISPVAQKQLVAVLAGLRLIVLSQNPLATRTVATAALRDCENQKQILADAKYLAKVDIDILDGKEEASLIGEFVGAQLPGVTKLLNVDTGGGSTDCSLIAGGKVVLSETFRIGTARKNGGEENEKNRFSGWLTANVGKNFTVTGSGGSVRKLCEICGDINESELQKQRAILSKMTVDQRIATFNLTPDRAQSVVPAMDIYLQLLKATGATEIKTINGGLGEAVIHKLAKKV